jgi:hypothetical protein
MLSLVLTVQVAVPSLELTLVQPSRRPVAFCCVGEPFPALGGP